MTCETCTKHPAQWTATRKGTSETWRVCSMCKDQAIRLNRPISFAPYEPATEEVVPPTTEPSTSLPYHQPEPSSGWSGTDTSRARARHRDESGLTGSVQARLLRLVTLSTSQGLTVAEARRALPDDHHGTISGALSNLHHDRLIERLAAKRDQCKVYVHPRYVNGRTTEMQGRSKKTGV